MDRTFTLLDANEEQLYGKNGKDDNGGYPIVCGGDNGFGDCRHAARSRLNKKKGASQNYGPHQRVDGKLVYYVGPMYIVASSPLDSGQQKWCLQVDGSFHPVDPETNREISPEEQIRLKIRTNPAPRIAELRAELEELEAAA